MQASRIRALAAVGASAVLTSAGVAATTTPAKAVGPPSTAVATAFAPADSADIQPGVQMYTDGAQ